MLFKEEEPQSECKKTAVQGSGNATENWQELMRDVLLAHPDGIEMGNFNQVFEVEFCTSAACIIVGETFSNRAGIEFI